MAKISVFNLFEFNSPQLAALMSFLRRHDYMDVGDRVTPGTVTEESSKMMSAYSGALLSLALASCVALPTAFMQSRMPE